MTDRSTTRRHGLQHVCAYLPDWANRLQILIEAHPTLSAHLTADTTSSAASDQGPSKPFNPSDPRGSVMTVKPSLAVHPGSRDQCVRDLQRSLYHAVMHDDPAALERALTLDRRLTQRARLGCVETVHTDTDSER